MGGRGQKRKAAGFPAASLKKQKLLELLFVTLGTVFSRRRFERDFAVVAPAAELAFLYGRHVYFVATLLHLEELRVAVLASYSLPVYLLGQMELVREGDSTLAADSLELEVRRSCEADTSESEGQDSRHHKNDKFFHFFTSFLFWSALREKKPLGFRRLAS
jgi:hypothetical protein